MALADTILKLAWLLWLELIVVGVRTGGIRGFDERVNLFAKIRFADDARLEQVKDNNNIFDAAAQARQRQDDLEAELLHAGVLALLDEVDEEAAGVIETGVKNEGGPIVVLEQGARLDA